MLPDVSLLIEVNDQKMFRLQAAETIVLSSYGVSPCIASQRRKSICSNDLVVGAVAHAQ